jgi:hypothetical protein
VKQLSRRTAEGVINSGLKYFQIHSLTPPAIQFPVSCVHNQKTFFLHAKQVEACNKIVVWNALAVKPFLRTMREHPKRTATPIPDIYDVLNKVYTNKFHMDVPHFALLTI